MAIGRLQPESPSKPIASTLGDLDSTVTTGRPCLVVPDYCRVCWARLERGALRLSKRRRQRELNQAGCKAGVQGNGSAEPARSNRRGRDVCGYVLGAFGRTAETSEFDSSPDAGKRSLAEAVSRRGGLDARDGEFQAFSANHRRVFRHGRLSLGERPLRWTSLRS